jgi:hypothetical protein
MCLIARVALDQVTREQFFNPIESHVGRIRHYRVQVRIAHSHRTMIHHRAQVCALDPAGRLPRGLDARRENHKVGAIARRNAPDILKLEHRSGVACHGSDERLAAKLPGPTCDAQLAEQVALAGQARIAPEREPVHF